MILLTSPLRQRLLTNGRNRGDHVPVVKFFNPVGAATWLFSELDEDGDTLFGLADLGFGCAELGSASLSEIKALRLRFGLRIERDLHFDGLYPLTVYAEAARHLGRITEHSDHLQAAAARLAAEKS
jgi:hypothetical protein